MQETPLRRIKTIASKMCFGLALLPTLAASQESAFVGEWLLWLEQGNARRPAYGTLAIEPSGGSVNVYIDGGPVNLLGLEEDRIRFDFDWTDVGDRVHLSILEGVLDDGVLTGTVTEEGEARGAWRATPTQRHGDRRLDKRHGEGRRPNQGVGPPGQGRAAASGAGALIAGDPRVAGEPRFGLPRRSRTGPGQSMVFPVPKSSCSENSSAGTQ